MMSTCKNFIINKEILRTRRTYYYNPHKMHQMAVNSKSTESVWKRMMTAQRRKTARDLQFKYRSVNSGYPTHLLALRPQAIHIMSLNFSFLNCGMRTMQHRTLVGIKWAYIYICIYIYELIYKWYIYYIYISSLMYKLYIYVSLYIYYIYKMSLYIYIRMEKMTQISDHSVLVSSSLFTIFRLLLQ